MHRQERNKGIKIETGYGPVGAPILQCVPGVRSAQDQWYAVRILEIVRVLGLSERPHHAMRQILVLTGRRMRQRLPPAKGKRGRAE